MGQLAKALADKGFEVSGSDKEFYEPMGSFLKDSSLKLFRGYREENVPSDVSLVVIGNAVSYGHPEVDLVEKQNLPYSFFSKLLYETAIEGRTSIAACGTHGKSTVAGMVASVLVKLKQDPSYFIGGVVHDLPSSLHAGTGSLSIVEGDEYDSAFFAKVPKFDFYAPDICIINAIEFDHADIYSNLEAIKTVFSLMVERLSGKAVLICCSDYPVIKELLSEWQKKTKAEIITFGEDNSATFRITERKQNGTLQSFNLESSNGDIEIKIPLIGLYNARNAAATVIACMHAGIPEDKITTALSSFQKVKRRQEIIIDSEELVLIEDFAHHPTAVAGTIAAVKEAFPDRELYAVFEPRSNTSRKKVFEDAYIKAFSMADFALISEVKKRALDTEDDIMDVSTLVEQISERTEAQALCLSGADAIVEWLTQNGAEKRVVLVMSNGSFDGIIEKLKSSLLG